MNGKITKAELVEALKLIEKYGDISKAARATGRNRSHLNQLAKKAQAEGLTAQTIIRDPLEAAKIEITDLRRQVKELQHEEETAAAIREQIHNIAAHDPNPPEWTFKQGSNGFRGMPMLLASDWHYGEVVRPQEVGGLNEFNSDIAATRIKRLTDTTIDLAFNHMGRAKTVYPGIVLMYGGDMISGDIHEELMVTNDRTPQQCINDLTDLMAAQVETLASKFGHIWIPCVTGNHGRSTKRIRFKGRVFCLDSATPILTRDLRWVPAGQLKVGDPLLAFEEEQLGRQGRRYKSAKVTYSKLKRTKTIAITLEDDRTIYATPEHKFLAHGKKGNSAVQWISAQEMLDHWNGDRKNKAAWKIDQYKPAWETNTSYQSGFLAAAFDGEGCLSRTNGTLQLSFNQTENDMLDTVKQYLEDLGFEWHVSVQPASKNRKTRHAIYISGGLSEIARFLGTVRPPRLMKKWSEFEIETAYFYKTKSLSIVDVQDGGVREIAELSSSSKTYISSGLASHNTSHEWNIYCNLKRYFKGSKNVAFNIPEGTDCRIDVYGHRYLLTHGDTIGVKGGDGIIGALGPIRRGEIKIRNSESQIDQDFDTLCMGHWHQEIFLPGLIVNNALKGYDEYARSALRAPYSRPSQMMWFTHPDHGITSRWTVYLEGLKQAEKPPTVSWTE